MSIPRSAGITVVGDALIDELHDPRGSREFVGGAALNVAVGLALLGEAVTLVAMVGDDEGGRRIRAVLDDYGVRLVASPSEFGTSRAVSVRHDGEPHYEFNQAARHRAIRFDRPTREALDGAGLVVVSCWPFDDDAQTAELRAAVERPAERLVIDANPRAGMLRDRAAFVDGFERLAADALLVKVGDEDAELLLGASLDALVERLQGVAAAEETGGRRRSPLAVLATAGRDGASVLQGALHAHAGIARLPGRVIDTMGAGDATLAAVVHRVARGGLPADEASWASALEAAMAIAAATVRHEGALLRLPPAEPGDLRTAFGS